MMIWCIHDNVYILLIMDLIVMKTLLYHFLNFFNM